MTKHTAKARKVAQCKISLYNNNKIPKTKFNVKAESE